MKISDLPTGVCSVTIVLHSTQETKRAHGKIIEKNGTKHLITRQSPKQSFGPGTKVLRFKKEAKITKEL